MRTALRGAPMERKRIRISAKRQITIPQKYFDKLGFEDEAECIVNGNELILRPIRAQSGGEFSEQILSELISQGYGGEELLKQFKLAQKKIRPAVENLIAEADELAEVDYQGATMD